MLGRHNGNHLALVCHLQHIVAEHLAGGLHVGTHGHGILDDLHGNTAGLGKLVERGRQATARGVAKATRVGRCGQNVGNQVVERRGVAFDRARKRQALALAHDGDAVVAQRTRYQNDIAGLAVGAAERHARGNLAHAGGIDIDTVGPAALNHFGVAGDNRHARLTRRLGHRLHNLAELIHGIALFEDKTAR